MGYIEIKRIDLGNGAICVIDGIGTKNWFLNDRRHRLDGPAIEYVCGVKHWSETAGNWSECVNQWFIGGIEYTEEEFDIAVQVLWAC